MNWKMDRKDSETIERIAARAADYLHSIHRPRERWQLHMDVAAVHCNGNPLRLNELLETDTENFMHDIVGIMAHLDRETGQLQDCFVPRFSLNRPTHKQEGNQ